MGTYMKLNQHFGKFVNDVISLDKTRVDRIDKALSHLSDFCSNDEEVSKAKIDLYLQGSYALGTGIKPIKGEFDVDVVLLLDVNQRPYDQQSAQSILKWLAARARTDKKWQGTISQEKRCVRITYAGDFHIDIVPAIPYTGTIIGIPNRNEDSWELSNPKGYSDYFAGENQKAKTDIRHIVKLFKWWRDKKFAEKSRPSSMLLTTLVCFSYPAEVSSLAEAFTVEMENLKRMCDNYTSKPPVKNPSLNSEDLARDWDDDAYSYFKDKVAEAAQKAREALENGDAEKSKELWSSVLPDFPQSISEEAKAVSEASKSGNLFAGTSGQITIGSSTAAGAVIAPHKFYGNEDR